MNTQLKVIRRNVYHKDQLIPAITVNWPQNTKIHHRWNSNAIRRNLWPVSQKNPEISSNVTIRGIYCYNSSWWWFCYFHHKYNINATCWWSTLTRHVLHWSDQHEHCDPALYRTMYEWCNSKHTEWKISHCLQNGYKIQHPYENIRVFHKYIMVAFLYSF